MASPRALIDDWIGAFEELYERGRAFTLTMHPWVIGRAGRLRELDRLLTHIEGFEHVAFRRAIDVAREVAAEAG